METPKFPPEAKALTRAEKAFVNALFNLLKDRRFDEIRVTDLLRTADYSRGAFYGKYEDKFDFIEKITNKIAHLDVNEQMKFMVLMVSKASPEEQVRQVSAWYKFLTEYRPFYEMLFDGLFPGISDEEYCFRCTEIIGQLTQSHFGKITIDVDNGIDEKLLCYIASYEWIALHKYWKRSGYKQSLEEMARHTLYTQRDYILNMRLERSTL